MKRTVVVTLGRLPKALDIVRSFSRLGWRVVVAEPFRRHLAGMSRHVARSCVVTAPAVDRERYLDDLAAVVEREQAELVVPVSEEAMHAAFVAPRLPAGTRLYGAAPATLLSLHDKQRFIERCGELGLAAPETHALGTDAAHSLAGGTDVVVKPVYSCSGRGVRFLPRGARLPEHAGQPEIVQQRVHGAVYSSFSLTHAGRVQATVVYRGAVMSGTVAVCFERVPVLPAVTSWVDAFVAATGFSGFVSFDFVVDASGKAWAIECNPRATSGLHFIHPDDLAAAIAFPERTTTPRFRDVRLMQQFFPCLTETQASFGDWPRFRHNLRHLFTARDVSWSATDPLPLLTMPWTAWNIISMARERGTSFGEVAMLDVGWYDAAAGAPHRPGAGQAG